HPGHRRHDAHKHAHDRNVWTHRLHYRTPDARGSAGLGTGWSSPTSAQEKGGRHAAWDNRTMSSGLKTAALLGGLSALLLLVGGAIGGQGGLLVAFAFAVVMNVGSY